MYSEFERKYSGAISKMGGILLILIFFLASVPFYFIAPNLTFGPIHIVGATITIVFSPFFFFGLSRYIKNRNVSIIEALRAKDKTFAIPPYGHAISLNQLLFAIACFFLVPIYFFTLHSYLITRAVNHFEIDARGTVVKSEKGISLVTFENSGIKYVRKVPGSFDSGQRVFVCLPPDADVSRMRIFTRRGPHTTGGMVAMGGIHMVLSLSIIGIIAAIFMKLKPKNL